MTKLHNTNTQKKASRLDLRQGQKQASKLYFCFDYSTTDNPLYTQDTKGVRW